MRLRARWSVLLVALVALAPPAAADDDDEDDRACGPLPLSVQDEPCDALDDPCDELDDPQPACGRLYRGPNEICLSLTLEPPGYSYSIQCWFQWGLREVRERAGLDDWNIRVDPPVRK